MTDVVKNDKDKKQQNQSTDDTPKIADSLSSEAKPLAKTAEPEKAVAPRSEDEKTRPDNTVAKPSSREEPSVHGAPSGSEQFPTSKESSVDINLLGGVPVTLALLVDSKQITIAELLKLQPGSIIQFDRKEHEPLDISLNGSLFAKGEVVLIGENYGLRILDIC